MKINAELILQLRKSKSWSQEELAIATGLNVRTIQRIEREQTASLQSRKAIAATFDIAVEDLDYEEVKMHKQFEFKMMEIPANDGFLSGITKQKLPNFTELFNEQGQQGWSLVQILTPELAKGVWTGKTGSFVAVMQREIIS